MTRPWLNTQLRAEYARLFDCKPEEVDSCLDARERMDAYAAERRERETPYGGRPRW